MRVLKILREVADEFGLLVITEALGVEHIPLVAEYADIIQFISFYYFKLRQSMLKLSKAKPNNTKRKLTLLIYNTVKSGK